MKKNKFLLSMLVLLFGLFFLSFANTSSASANAKTKIYWQHGTPIELRHKYSNKSGSLTFKATNKNVKIYYKIEGVIETKNNPKYRVSKNVYFFIIKDDYYAAKVINPKKLELFEWNDDDSNYDYMGTVHRIN